MQLTTILVVEVNIIERHFSCNGLGVAAACDDNDDIVTQVSSKYKNRW